MASKQYFNPETAVIFAPSGGTVTFTPTSLADQSARISNQVDRGAGAMPGLYRWFARTKGSAALTIARNVEIYLSQAVDATYLPGRVGTTDATIASAVDRMRNLTPVGIINADTTDNTQFLIASGLVFVYTRYYSVIWLNRLGLALSATAGDHEFVMQPVPPEQQ